VGEVKRVKDTFWAPDFADDKAKFLDATSGYVPRFLGKVEWARGNWRALCAHLAQAGVLARVPASAPALCHAIVTDSETVAQVFTDETQIISYRRLLAEFDATEEWSFSSA